MFPHMLQRSAVLLPYQLLFHRNSEPNGVLILYHPTIASLSFMLPVKNGWLWSIDNAKAESRA